ncbi:MAG: hypothetical protein JRJ65_18615 [Deltaproteobacteria bacterium]|nr:hypothetical protein [Deltaproteobacteria bacterium]
MNIGKLSIRYSDLLNAIFQTDQWLLDAVSRQQSSNTFGEIEEGLGQMVCGQSKTFKLKGSHALFFDPEFNVHFREIIFEFLRRENKMPCPIKIIGTLSIRFSFYEDVYIVS